MIYLNGYKIFKEGKGNRDPIFLEALSLLEGKPANILEIGAMRDVNGRAGDGFSTFFFAEYIKQYGGHITVCDISKNGLDNCRQILGEYLDNTQITYHLGPGLNHLTNTSEIYNLTLLDGSDDPNEMLAEYEACKSRFILCDDFSTKGFLLRQKYPDFKLYKWHHAGHECALYGVPKETVFLPNLL